MKLSPHYSEKKKKEKTSTLQELNHVTCSGEK